MGVGMSRWNDQLDDPWTEDGDAFFIGYDEKNNPSVLPNGYVSRSINKRFFDQTASPRKGTTMPPVNAHLRSNVHLPKIYGSFVYNNPNGSEQLVLAGVLQVPGYIRVYTYDFNTDAFSEVTMPAGVYPLGEVWFAQGFDKLLMLDAHMSRMTGHQHETNGLQWTGNSNQPFQWFTWGGDPELDVIVPSIRAWPVSGRIAYLPTKVRTDPPPYLAIHRMDHLILSDILDYQNYDFVLADFRINAGESDSIMTVVPYAFDTMVIFMARSIHILSNFSLDPLLASQERITSYLGTCSPRSAIEVGAEVYFMAEKLGVFRLSEVLEKRMKNPPLAVSDPIQPVIDRINWQYRDIIIAAADDHYLYFAVPLDGSTVNNAVLVFNLTSGNWETVDSWSAIPGFHIDNLLSVHIDDVKRLIAVQNFPPLIYLLYEGTMDQTLFDVINPRFAAVSDLLETRAYGILQATNLRGQSSPVSFNAFHRGAIVMETINPNVKITGITEGENEEKVLRPSITKDPAKFYIHGHPDFVIGGNFFEEKRQDYTTPGVPPPPFPMFDAQDFSQVLEGALSDGLIPPLIQSSDTTQIPPVPQTSRERFPIRMTDRWLSLRIENTQGTCKLLATSVESTESKRNARTAA